MPASFLSYAYLYPYLSFHLQGFRSGMPEVWKMGSGRAGLVALISYLYPCPDSYLCSYLQGVRRGMPVMWEVG